MDQISGTADADTSSHAQAQGQVQPQAQVQPQSQPEPAPLASTEAPGFRSRGRARRRARFLRKARELAYRDLGGLVFNLHRFGQRNDALVLAKLTTLGHIDTELRALEGALEERRPVTVLREAGITACPRCAAIHSSEDSFCPNCGLSMSRHVDLLGDFQSPAGAAAAPATRPGLAPQSPSPTAGASAPPPAPAPSTPPAGRSDPSPAPAPAPMPASAPAPARTPDAPSTTSSRSATPTQDEPTEILGPPVSGGS